MLSVRDRFLPVSCPTLQADEIDRVVDVLRSGMWTTGPVTTQFEEKLSVYLDNTPCVGLNSCTAALFLGLLATGVKPGDEVIVPVWTFAATAHVVEWLGAKPILCDIESASLNIDVAKAEVLCNAKTKAIMPVHMAGYPCDMNAIADLAQQRGLIVVEDAAHAIGTKYKEKKIGTLSDVTCFSFYATKNLAMGEGGAVSCPDPDLAERIRALGYFGINKSAFKRYEKAGAWRYDVEALGYKYNLDSMHAAIGLVQLEHLDAANRYRRHLAARYREKLPVGIIPTVNSPEHYHTHHIYPVILPEGVDRDDFFQNLKKYNIGASVHFMPLHLHSYYAPRYPRGSFPVAEAVFERIITLPMHNSMTEEDVDYVSEVCAGLIA